LELFSDDVDCWFIDSTINLKKEKEDF
jgi:hypothetical protein